MRFIRYAILAVIAFTLVSVMLANNVIVELKLVPEALVELIQVNFDVSLDFAVSLPLFAVALGGVAVGLALGYLAEYMRERKHRQEARAHRGEARKLAREVKKLKSQKNEGKDEVLALLEEAR